MNFVEPSLSLSVKGVDIAGVKAVIQYGIPSNVPEGLQRGSRCGRSTSELSIFLIMYEPWVKELDLGLVSLEARMADPDCPMAGTLTPSSTKRDRTGYMIVLIIQTLVCLRLLFARYLMDHSDEGDKLVILWYHF